MSHTFAPWHSIPFATPRAAATYCAQKALRKAAGLGPEMFPVEAFVGMISDEIETLRSLGKTDRDIAALITENSSIQITAEEISANYASPEDRHQAH